MTLPPPDYSVPPENPCSGQEIVMVIPCEREECRFVITVDAAKHFRVFSDDWITSWVGDGGDAVWIRHGPLHLTSSLSEARSCIEIFLQTPDA